MENLFEKLKFWFKKVYRLSLAQQKWEGLVWKDLKKYHQLRGFESGVYEVQKYIEAKFEIAPGNVGTYYHLVYDAALHCRTRVLVDFDVDITTDVFVLSAHLNNILKNGTVTIDVDGCYVEFKIKKDLLLPLLYPGEIEQAILQHYSTSKDIFASFQRLVEEGEAPAIIIADLLNEVEKRNAQKH